MKKIISVVLLFYALAGAAFAELALNGEAYFGIQFEKQESSEDEQLTTTHRKEGMPMVGLDVVYTDDNFGLKTATVLRAKDDPFTLKGVYGWASFFDYSLDVLIGKINDPKWVVCVDPDTERYYDDILGLRVEYTVPFLEGLSVGFAVPFDKSDLENTGKRIIYGFDYIHPFFTAVGAYQLAYNTRFIFGFDFTGVPDLTAGFQIQGLKLALWERESFLAELEFYEKIGYNIIQPLTISLLLGQTMYADKKMDVSLSFAPTISYHITPNMLCSLSVAVSSTDMFETIKNVVKPVFEYKIGSYTVLYVQYECDIRNEYDIRTAHRLGIGIDIKSFSLSR
jgi:hypothetical protein